ncbi:MAG: hypothetical protein MMC23_000112 [Stictis urceolatum]|nr:hypothetical protein [Stictis urceolata]
MRSPSLIYGIILPVASAAAVAIDKRDFNFYSITNNTVDTPHLKTWWHDSGEVNTWTVVQDGNVRQSHLYVVQVASSQDSTAVYYDSFVYESLPRNGHGNILDPRDLQSTTDEIDGISIERDIGLTMAWSSFLYDSDAYVRVARPDGAKATKTNVLIRPTNVQYNINDLDGAIYVHVPYDNHGFKFSVEFQDDLYNFRDSCASTSCGYVQSENPNGTDYVESYTKDNPIVSTEPLNGLMVFASPFLDEDMKPDPKAETTYVAQPGFVSGLDQIESKTVYFGPGVYWFGGLAHANLSSSVDWVHLEEGAYVKGAIQFNTKAAEMKATGHGVLSGEQYVYQANPTVGYRNQKSNDDCLRMWRGNSVAGLQQTFTLNGPTVNAPPFNSMDFIGDLDTISVQAHDYKQVGAFFAQTDGLQVYPNSHVHDVFYHSNDDTIKTYFSNATIERIMVWKAHTAPIIQFGWASRNLTNVTVDDITVIHSRWNTNASHPSIIGGNQIYEMSEDATNTAELCNTISNITYSNIRAEGISGNLFRIMPLANIDGFTIRNVSLHSYPVWTSGISGSQLVAMTDSNNNPVTVKGFIVDGFSVGGDVVSYAADNWDTSATGNLNIAPEFVNAGDVKIVAGNG